MSGQQHLEQERPEREASRESREPSETGETPREHGGPSGPEPTRYGDWERGGRCSDF